MKKNPEVFVTKIPQNSSELLFYTQKTAEQLSDSGIVQIPEKENEVCIFFFLQGQTQCVGMYKITGSERKRRKLYFQSCYFCREQYELVSCGWIQVVHSVMSLSIPEQEQRGRLCPYLKGTVDAPMK